MVVEPVEVGADRSEPEQRQRIAPLGEHPAELVEAGEQARGHVGGHGRESTTKAAGGSWARNSGRRRGD